MAVPDIFYRSRLKRKLEAAASRPDYEYMQQRVDYYIRIRNPWTMASQDSLKINGGCLFYTGAIGSYKRKYVSSA